MKKLLNLTLAGGALICSSNLRAEESFHTSMDSNTPILENATNELNAALDEFRGNKDQRSAANNRLAPIGVNVSGAELKASGTCYPTKFSDVWINDLGKGKSLNGISFSKDEMGVGIFKLQKNGSLKIESTKLKLRGLLGGDRFPHTVYGEKKGLLGSLFVSIDIDDSMVDNSKMPKGQKAGEAEIIIYKNNKPIYQARKVACFLWRKE